MQYIHAKQVASISELKKNPTKLINDADGKPVAILNHNVATAYLIPVETYEIILELLDNQQLEKLVNERLNTPFEPIQVDIDEQ